MGNFIFWVWILAPMAVPVLLIDPRQQIARRVAHACLLAGAGSIAFFQSYFLAYFLAVVLHVCALSIALWARSAVLDWRQSESATLRTDAQVDAKDGR